MLFSTSITAFSLLVGSALSAATRPTGYGPSGGNNGGGGKPWSLPQPSAEQYETLGCPATTKKDATFPEQLAALTEFGSILFTNKDAATAINKYYAADIINHTPEVTQNGTAAAIAVLAQRLPGSDVTIEKEWVGASQQFTVYGTIQVKIVAQGATINLATILRMIGTCMVEIWDVQGIAEPSGNPISPF